jgi:hypothetical protein
MNEYQPLNLADTCNTGIAFLGLAEEPLVGVQSFRGLPFLVGAAKPDPERCLIGFGSLLNQVSIPVNSTAHWILFAHTLLESGIDDGDPIGEVVASYTICFAEGESVRLPVRERFEVGLVPTPWGQFPFLAVPDEPDQLMARYLGEWEQFGNRLVEAHNAIPRAYFLWAWQNPQPERQSRRLS